MSLNTLQSMNYNIDNRVIEGTASSLKKVVTISGPTNHIITIDPNQGSIFEVYDGGETAFEIRFAELNNKFSITGSSICVNLHLTMPSKTIISWPENIIWDMKVGGSRVLNYASAVLFTVSPEFTEHNLLEFTQLNLNTNIKWVAKNVRCIYDLSRYTMSDLTYYGDIEFYPMITSTSGLYAPDGYTLNSSISAVGCQGYPSSSSTAPVQSIFGSQSSSEYFLSSLVGMEYNNKYWFRFGVSGSDDLNNAYLIALEIGTSYVIYIKDANISTNGWVEISSDFFSTVYNSAQLNMPNSNSFSRNSMVTMKVYLS